MTPLPPLLRPLAGLLVRTSPGLPTSVWVMYMCRRLLLESRLGRRRVWLPRLIPLSVLTVRPPLIIERQHRVITMPLRVARRGIRQNPRNISLTRPPCMLVSRAVPRLLSPWFLSPMEFPEGALT